MSGDAPPLHCSPHLSPCTSHLHVLQEQAQLLQDCLHLALQHRVVERVRVVLVPAVLTVHRQQLMDAKRGGGVS